MKLFKIYFSLLILNNITVFAQSYDNQSFINLIQTKKWFEIEDYYQHLKDSIDYEQVKPVYLAMTGEVFNRPDEAIDAYEYLIETNPFHKDAPTLINLFGQPVLQLCFNVQKYTKGEELCQKLITISEKDSTINSDVRLQCVQWLASAIESFKQFSKNIPILTVIKNKVDSKEEVKLLPDRNKSGNGIFFNAKWNGVNLRTIFDTGTGTGAYIYNRAIAEKIGVKFNSPDTIMMNGNIHGMLGLVDSLELGNFTIKNVPVFVNIETVDFPDSTRVKCDSTLNSWLDIVLGISVIKHLGAIEFDFVKNVMSFSQKTDTVNKRNLYIDNILYMNMEICDKNFLTYFDTGGEGVGLSINTDFYEKYKQCISIEAEAKQIKDRTGSCNEASLSNRYEYKCPQIDIKINDQVTTMINDCSVAKDKENDNKFGATEGGYLGNAIFKYCKKATFDFDNMVFSIGK